MKRKFCVADTTVKRTTTYYEIEAETRDEAIQILMDTDQQPTSTFGKVIDSDVDAWEAQ